eukprot:4511764-Alexandrium_andersonii.AAC.1
MASRWAARPPGAGGGGRPPSPRTGPGSWPGRPAKAATGSPSTAGPPCSRWGGRRAADQAADPRGWPG